MKNSCNSSFSWCLSATTETIKEISNSLDWDKNQPDNLGGNETCLHLKILKTGGLKLTDKNCASKFIVACKVFFLILTNILNHTKKSSEGKSRKSRT
jgi:hypothetical protein